MRRYLRLYKYFLEFSLMSAMQFRMDFFFRIIMDCTFYAVHLMLFKVLYNHSGLLGGWTQSEAMIFISGFLMVDAIQMTIISNGTWMIPQLINKGELDYYLLRPVSTLFFLTTRDFAFNSFINVIVAAGIMIWAFSLSPVAYPIYKILLYLFLVCNGTYLFYLLRILTLTPVFWTHSGRGFEMIFWTLDKFAERPDGIYKGWIRRILTTFMPFAIIASFPARTLFQDNYLEIAGYCVLVVAIVHIITMKFWQLGLKNYSSASS